MTNDTATQDPATTSLFPGTSEMARRMRSLDWSRTGAGDPATWPDSLRTAISICLGSRFPIIVFWGRDLLFFYNDACRPILGEQKHPQFLGQPAEHAWTEIWDTIGPMLHGVLDSGEATWSEDLPLPMVRNDFLEETYFTFSYSPLRDGDSVAGVFCACQETTEQVLGRRRLETLRNVAVAAETGTDAAVGIVRVLAENPLDIPFAFIAEPRPDAPPLVLAATDGITDTAMPLELWAAVDRVGRTGEPLEVALDPTRALPIRTGAWPVAPTAALANRVGSGPRDRGLVLVTGVGAGLPFDAAYRRFLLLVATQASAAIAKARAYDEERQRAQALAELDAAKSTFFSNVSHEFRTPLTLMLGPLGELDAGVGRALAPEDRELLLIAQRNGRRLLRLVNGLLDFARIEAGRVKAELVATDLARATESTASMFRSAFELAGVDLRISAPPLSRPVPVDPEMWEKIVLNLVSNAFKYTLAGHVSVTLREDAATNEVELTVADTGVGVAADELPRLFERFHRVEGVNGRSQEGSGIGLSLVDELVRLHGGRITAESEEGVGSTFRVRVPIRPVPETGATASPASAEPWAPRMAAPFVDEALRWLPGTPVMGASVVLEEPVDVGAAVPVAPLGGGRILVADDNSDMRDYFFRLLAGRWRVDAVADGQAALEAATADPPDIVIADVMMPRLNGLELLRALRADPRTERVPIMLVSARAGEEARIEALEAGADDYLVKPFSPRELVAAVNARLEIARVRDANREAVEHALAEEAAHSRALEAKQTELERANAAKDEFLGLVSHELRTPITTILGNAEVLRRRLERLDGATRASLISDIGSEAERLNRIIENLLVLARGSGGPSESEPILVDRIVERVILQQEEQAPHAVIRFHGSHGEAVVEAPPIQVEQVVRNLVSNAVKYGGKEPILVQVSAADEQVEVRVSDRGIGFASKETRTSFAPFERSAEAAALAGGVGIGLVVCQRIVESLGGRMWAHGREGGGAEVGFSLPATPLGDGVPA